MALLVEIAEIRRMVSKGDKTAADAARLLKIHPAAKTRRQGRPNMPKNVDDSKPNNSESDKKNKFSLA